MSLDVLSETSTRIDAAEIAERLGLPQPTDQQRAVIEAPLSPAIVVAGAGSGKTETMANRVVWLLANRLVEPAQILGLTFTRKAAGELAARIRTRVAQLTALTGGLRDGDPFDAPTVSTYNAFASAIFRENALLIGREPDATVMSEASAWQLARRLVVGSSDERLVELDKSVDLVTSAVISLSRALSENVVRAEDVASMVAEFRELAELPVGNARVKGLYKSVRDAVGAVGSLPPLLELAEAFDAEKRRRGFVEFSDQVALALAVCERVPRVVEELRSRFRVVLLDEYQDTSVVQTRLLSLLFARQPVMAVGDPHQSIYGWRGASAANLARFAADFGDTPDGALAYPLSTSWRNPTRVLRAANTLVRPLSLASPVRVGELQPRPDAADGSIEVAFEQTVGEEAERVSAWFERELSRGDGPRTAAILCRSIKKIDAFTSALADRGIPFHVLGLGGLLDQPVIADLVCALRVIHDPTAGSELIRLLTGARWRVGPKDIQALRQLASWIARRDYRQQLLDDQVRDRLRQSVVGEEGVSLVDALDFLIEAPRGHSAVVGFSEAGLDRMRRAGEQIAYLRTRVGLDLTDLTTLVVQELLLDIEVAANETARLGRASLDAFAEQVAAYESMDDSATLGSFLSWLAEAERRDNLAPRSEDPEPGCVQIMTIHGAKGLEWDLVAVPRMVDDELPGRPQSKRGWLEFGGLPYEFRGDAAELPLLAWRGARTQKEFDDAFGEFEDGIVARHADEQRRLVYVAVTRSRSRLLLSGSYWSTQTRPRGPGLFLRELQDAGMIPSDSIPECADPDENPYAAQAERVSWPLDPLGRRAHSVRAAAHEVRVAAEELHDHDRAARAGRYQDDLDLLLAERDARIRGAELVPLPTRIPASRFKDFVTDPAQVASRLRRPMPERPYRQTRLGTLFHAWVEERYGTVGPTDYLDSSVSELDDDRDGAPAELAELDALREIFERSPWAALKPVHVEVEIHAPLAGRVIVCKLDAVFASSDPRFDYQIVDWKTGRPPADSEDLERKQFQLALYRAAFASWKGVDPDRVDAIFYFVSDDRVVRPERLYSEEELSSLWSSRMGFSPSDGEKSSPERSPGV
jgi:DNA helicase-2/ATP-dependent DNA helicase PcrA